VQYKFKTNDYRVKISASLKDGSIVETNTLDDVLSLENLGTKQVKELTLIYDDGKEESDWGILIQFNDGSVGESWTSMLFDVVGQSRDWAFLAASDIEERFRKIKTQSAEYFLTGSRLSFMIPIAIGAGLFALSTLTLTFSSKSAIDQLEIAYKNGVVKDPIEAMIFLERAREASKYKDTLTYGIFAVLSYLIPWSIWSLLRKFIPTISPSYNFYWGDYIAYFDKRKSTANIFWTVIVLGVIVSIVSAYILRLLP